MKAVLRTLALALPLVSLVALVGLAQRPPTPSATPPPVVVPTAVALPTGTLRPLARPAFTVTGLLLTVPPGDAAKTKIFVPGVTVVLKDLIKNADVAKARTDLSGRFRFPMRPPSRYQVCWNARGFSPGCTKAFPIVKAHVYLGLVPIAVASSGPTGGPRGGRTLYGQVTFTNGKRPRFLDQVFGVNAFARVTASNRNDPGAKPVRDAWLDTMAGELVDVVAHAAAAGEVDYACWIAEGLVDYLTRQGRYQECGAALEIALSKADRATDRRMASSLRIGMGLVHGMRGRFEQAAAWGADALQLSRRAGDLREQARALGGLGMLDRIVGRNVEAIARLTEVVELARRLGDVWLGGTAICNLGAVHQQLGQYEDARACFANVLELVEKAGSPRALAKALCYSGGLHLELGQFPEAAAELRRAVETAERIGDVPVLTYGLTRLGSAEQGLGNVGTALELHRRALAALTEQTAAVLEMEVRNRLAASHLAAGDLAQAQHQFELVLTLTETNPNPAEQTTAREGLTRCHQPTVLLDDSRR